MIFNLDKLISEIQNKIEIIDIFIENYKKDFEKSQEAINSFANNVANIIENFQHSEKNINNKIEKLEEIHNEVIAESTTRKNEIHSLKKIAEDIEKKLNSLDNRIKNIHNEYNNFTNKYDLELTQLKEIKDKTEKSLLSFSKTLKNSKKEFDSISNEIEKLKNKYFKDIEIQIELNKKLDLFIEEFKNQYNQNLKKIETDLIENIKKNLDENYSLYEEYEKSFEITSNRIFNNISEMKKDISNLKLYIARVDSKIDVRMEELFSNLENNLKSFIEEKLSSKKGFFKNVLKK